MQFTRSQCGDSPVLPSLNLSFVFLTLHFLVIQILKSCFVCLFLMCFQGLLLVTVVWQHWNEPCQSLDSWLESFITQPPVYMKFRGALYFGGFKPFKNLAEMSQNL